MSFCWNFHHWLHWKLSEWQLPIQPVIKFQQNDISVSVYILRTSCAASDGNFNKMAFPFHCTLWSNLCFMLTIGIRFLTLQWCHNECDGVSNHQRLYYLLNRLFRRRPKKTSKLRVTGLCEGNPQVTGGYPHKGPVMQKMFPYDDVIMMACLILFYWIFPLTYLIHDKMAAILQMTFSDAYSWMNEKFCILFKISLKFVAMDPVDNSSGLV